MEQFQHGAVRGREFQPDLDGIDTGHGGGRSADLVLQFVLRHSAESEIQGEPLRGRYSSFRSSWRQAQFPRGNIRSDQSGRKCYGGGGARASFRAIQCAVDGAHFIRGRISLTVTEYIIGAVMRIYDIISARAFRF